MRYRKQVQHIRRYRTHRTLVNRGIRYRVPKRATFYHVTQRKLLPSIMKKGLIPQKPSSIFGEQSKNDPKAVYTFRNPISDSIPYEAIEDFMKTPSETSTLKKIKAGKSISFEPVILKISMPNSEVENIKLPKSYGARDIESPLKGPIPPNKIRIMKQRDYIRKAGKIKGAITDFYSSRNLGPKEMVAFYEDRGPNALRELFK
jgi:hypothetical protein